ncbi:MAG TPA: leucyl aminopeptidase, partial [Thermomicrobiales bacterium]|nr:leucyl aminopeptidase [Thermomicrobiales bacterium]
TVKEIDTALSGGLQELAAEARFNAKIGKTLVVPTFGRTASRRIVLAGVGPVANLTGDAVSRAAGAASRAARDAGARHLVIAIPDPGWDMNPATILEAAAIGVILGLYQFTRYRGAASPESAKGPQVESVRFLGPQHLDEQAERALGRAEAISRGVNLARDLGNEPASTLTPDEFANRAASVAESSGLEIEILGPAELAKIGAAATLAVGGGSIHSPRLIRLCYRPEVTPAESRIPGLVGKAITFDTGGYSIKPYEGMLDMKGDMSGGAAVLGAMSALKELECQFTVEATICAAENMISGTAFRPGDVITGMNGVTMEILSTDAEGRLVLADGLVDTARRGATELIDLATLTGAAVVALGEGTTALFATDDHLAEELLSSSSEVGERMWRMPLIDELEQKIEGDVADIKNTGGRAGGAITAALFLKHFSERLPWAHLDIAGSARQQKASSIGPKGATGVGVRTLLQYLTG